MKEDETILRLQVDGITPMTALEFRGELCRFTAWLGAVILAGILLSMPFNPPDHTDEGWFSRSRLGHRVNSATGCHYLTARGGGIIEELDAEGEHVCTGEDTP